MNFPIIRVHPKRRCHWHTKWCLVNFLPTMIFLIATLQVPLNRTFTFNLVIIDNLLKAILQFFSIHFLKCLFSISVFFALFFLSNIKCIVENFYVLYLIEIEIWYLPFVTVLMSSQQDVIHCLIRSSILLIEYIIQLESQLRIYHSSSYVRILFHIYILNFFPLNVFVCVCFRVANGFLNLKFQLNSDWTCLLTWNILFFCNIIDCTLIEKSNLPIYGYKPFLYYQQNSFDTQSVCLYGHVIFLLCWFMTLWL